LRKKLKDLLLPPQLRVVPVKDRRAVEEDQLLVSDAPGYIAVLLFVDTVEK